MAIWFRRLPDHDPPLTFSRTKQQPMNYYRLFLFVLKGDDMAKKKRAKKKPVPASTSSIFPKAIERKMDKILAAIKRLKSAIAVTRAANDDPSAELSLRLLLGQHFNEYVSVLNELGLKGAAKSVSLAVHMSAQQLSLHGRLASKSPETVQHWLYEKLPWPKVTRRLITRPSSRDVQEQDHMHVDESFKG